MMKLRFYSKNFRNSKHNIYFIYINLLIKKFSIGDNIRMLLERPDGLYTFRLHRERVYYCRFDLNKHKNVQPNLIFVSFSEAIIKYASNFPRKELLSFGTCFGRFTKTRKFRLHITALDFIAPYAKVHKA